MSLANAPYPCYWTPAPARNRLIRLLQRQRLKQGLGAKTLSLEAGYGPKLLHDWEKGNTKNDAIAAYIDIVKALGGEVVIRFPDEEIVA